MTRWQAEQGGWQEATLREEEKLSATIQQISTTLRHFEDQGRIKEAVPVQKYIDPVSEKIEDSLDQAELFEDIAASYSVTQEEIPDDDLDPIVPIRPAQALAAIRTLKDWEEQQDDSTQQVIKQLKDLEKRVRALQLLNSKQTTLDSYLV
jgi:inorganic pyrophosphatase